MKNISRQKIGLLCALCACVLFWLPIYKVNTYFLFFPLGEKNIHLVPNLLSGIWSLGIVFLIYIRGIISFKTKKTRLCSILINWALFATFLEIFISPTNEKSGYTGVANNVTLLIIAVVFVCILIFGVKEIAKLALLFFIAGSFFSNLVMVSESMGIYGFIALALIITSFYLQGNINIKNLEIETKYLYANSKVESIKLVDCARKEIKPTVSRIR